MPADTLSTTTPKHQFFCTYCGKRFTRKEHLERHIPQHTGTRPYKCARCHVGYNRKDLLQRHIQNTHEIRDSSEPSNDSMAAAAGHRNPIACERCFNAKTRCDRNEPCESCVKRGYLGCKKRYSKRSGNKATSRKPQIRPQRAVQEPTPPLQPGFSGPTSVYSPQQQQQQLASILPSLMGSSLPMSRSATSLSSHGLTGFSASPTHVTQDIHFTQPSVSPFSDRNYPPATAAMNYQPYTEQYMGPDFDMDMNGLSSIPIDNQMWANIDTLSGIPTPSSGIVPEFHTRQTSLAPSVAQDDRGGSLDISFAATSYSTILELEDVVKAESDWPLARCTKKMFSNPCPKTGLAHLTCFERYLRRTDTWKSLERFVGNELSNGSRGSFPELNSVVPLADQARDHMTAITQQFLHKALDIHGSKAASNGLSSRYVILPPALIIQYFLRSYVRSLSVYYPLVVSGRLDPNDMINRSGPSTLLLLLMIAQGAAAVPIAEARYLSTGLTETCRISLFDIIEKNVELSADPVALRCALLFTLLGSWSGDKWLMDISMGQRNMYLSMLRHSGMLESQPAVLASHRWHESQHKDWIDQESRNRLVSNWVMLDQELALFHDARPLFSVTELQYPLPASENLWMTRDSKTWVASMSSMNYLYGNSYQSKKPSVFSLFQELLQRRLLASHSALSPQTLRLLLHPIQAELFHLRQLYSCCDGTLGGSIMDTQGQSSTTRANVQQRINEISDILDEWHTLTLESTSWENRLCPLTRCNIVMYHLICLNVATDFPEIERLARREDLDDSGPSLYLDLSMRQGRCIFAREDAIYHSGQVLGLLHHMPARYRPSWWTAAMYRAVLILWADSLCQLNPSFGDDSRQLDPSFGDNSDLNGAGPAGVASGSINPLDLDCHGLVSIDQVGLDKGKIAATIWQRVGVIVLCSPDGSPISLDMPSNILEYGIRMIDEADSSRFGDGIRRKLYSLCATWADIDLVNVVSRL